MVLDVIFLIGYVSKVPKLFLPSLIVLFGTSGLNLLIAFIFIMSQANTNKEFKKWMRPRLHVATAFVLLSIFHIDVLGILTSEFLHSDVFNAPVSNRAEKFLNKIGLFMVLLEDVSQFVILVS
ncbi:858_t:CDS:2 [Funneliformis geosporum]|uniref:7908_t:CDS:1 n=1 Tax=Funneliformis geosporum TaxID=1117311 RepID=A0A9W4WJV4_9GLOM|nr:7908_t:CDS:2 [Funneliformis geosporum]CAI2168049.1 858_t:CDS:2 [Funneliformis geosporum]